MDRGGDSRFGRRLYQWKGSVASSPDYHIGLKFPKDCPGFPGGAQQIAGGNQVMFDLMGLEGAVKAGDVNGPKVIPRLWHQVLFQAPFRSHEENLHSRLFFPRQLCQGNGRVDVSCCSATGKYHFMQFLFHTNISPCQNNGALSAVPQRRSGCREIPSRQPDWGEHSPRSSILPLSDASAWIPTGQFPSPPAEWTARYRHS